ncbi:MAG TPA: glycosyltransferase N-terminal domain-containing protein [Bacteroidia bacterium]|nr:glycosyltransferase N-terminal domain-containing protein [Bacteroidia bacterium]
MEFIYLAGVKIYGAGILAVSFFNEKAKKWVEGRKNIFQTIQNSFGGKNEKRIWFHCASLGEFEQGKPIIESIKKNYTEFKIVVSFFSPSGFEARKNDPVADYVFYLPLDGPRNAKKFLDMVQPTMVFFVKYDFWHFYIREMKKRKIPLYFISANFRPSQIFFQWYGTFFDKMLRRVTHLFVQNQQSLELLYRHSIPQVTVSGDTRFDRVYENSLSVKSFPEIEKFCGGEKIFIAGSTWQEDEAVIAEFINQSDQNFKFIIVPHEIKEAQIHNFIKSVFKKSIRYSELNKSGNTDPQVLIIDNIGMLSSLYRYADFAYIGGAFGKGLHNILEAVVFGKPVFFGPNYQKFPEAGELIKSKTAFSISSAAELKTKIDELLSSDEEKKKIEVAGKNYIEKNKGATNLVMNYLKFNFGENPG